MKLKISPLFLQNQYNNLIKAGPLLKGFTFSCFVLLNVSLFAQEKLNSPVLNFEQLVKEQKKNYLKTLTGIEASLRELTNLEKVIDIQVHPEQLKIFMTKSYSRYLKNAHTPCDLFELIRHGLVKNHFGTPVKHLYVKVKRKNLFSEYYYKISLNTLEKILKKRKCPNFNQFKNDFTQKNFSKTIKGLKLQSPQNKTECKNIFSSWHRHPKLVPLCGAYEKIKRGKVADLKLLHQEKYTINTVEKLEEARDIGKALEDQISYFQKNYIRELCKNIFTSEKNFCETFEKQDLWTQVIMGEISPLKVYYKCSNIFNKKIVSNLDLLKCTNKLKKENTYCHVNGATKMPSLFPHPSCHEISEALKVSKLKTDYHDCPATLDHLAISNISRIISHFSPEKNRSHIPQKCSGKSNEIFAQMNISSDNEEAWPVRICTMDRISEKEVCHPYTPGYGSSALSENKVLEKLILKNYGKVSKLDCQFINKKSYGPYLLQYKVGCYVIYDEKSCTDDYCTKKIIVNEKEIKGIKYKGEVLLSYFPNGLQNSRLAQTNIFKKKLKLREAKVKSYTDLKFQLKLSKNSILHGVGCLEDIHPRHFQKLSLNQCTPLPFIVDGYKENKEKYVLIRSSISDIHSPKLILWQHLYTAVYNYHNLHPQKAWTLYAIRK